jgi:ABC-type glutathione transport system ATPase component
MSDNPEEPRLRMEGLTYRYCVGSRPFGMQPVNTLDGVSLCVARAETLAIVGESGSGKSTLGRIVLGLLRPQAGRVLLNGRALEAHASEGERNLIQAIFQNPVMSFDPRLTVGEQIGEALTIHGMRGRDPIAERMRHVAARLGLSPAVLARRPGQLSGGQCQRAAIVRALIVEPELVVCDEPVAALDLSAQAQTLHLLREQQRLRGLSYLFITHDLRVARAVAHRSAVLHRGRIVEVAATEELFRAPRHPYTMSLLAAAPGARWTAALEKSA